MTFKAVKRISISVSLAFLFFGCSTTATITTPAILSLLPLLQFQLQIQQLKYVIHKKGASYFK